MKIFVPTTITIDSNSCYTSDNSSITIYTNNVAYNYRYNDQIGDYEVLSQISVNDIPVQCHSADFTNEVFYRKDIADIMVVFFILTIICFYFPYRIFSRAFGRWLKL